MHRELTRVVNEVRGFLYKKFRDKAPQMLAHRDFTANIGSMVGDATYYGLTLRLTTDPGPQPGTLANAKKVGDFLQISVFDVLGPYYKSSLPEFFDAPTFIEALAHEMTHQIQNINDADLLLGPRPPRANYETDGAAAYHNSPRELQAFVMSAIQKFSQHAKVRGGKAFWDWAEKQPLFREWIEHANPASKATATRIVREVLGD